MALWSRTRSVPLEKEASVIGQRPVTLPNKRKKKAVKGDTFDIKAVPHPDPSSPYDFESVTLTIRRQDYEVKGTRRANTGRQTQQHRSEPLKGTKETNTAPHEEEHKLMDVHTQASTLLNWLSNLAALCESDNTVLHSEVFHQLASHMHMG